MCKLLTILDIEDTENAAEFMKLAVKPMTAKDDDGLGIVMLGENGMNVERWLNPADFPNPANVPVGMEKYAQLLPGGYSSEGVKNIEGLYAIGMHSRMATSPKCLENVHPFVRDGMALIHNGVISNHSQFEKEVSSCDSEALLSLYLTHDVKTKLENIQLVCDEAIGYYAFIVFDPASKTVTIVKDNTTTLYFAKVSTVGMVFCTAAEIIKGVCGRMKLPQPIIYTFIEDTAMRWTKDAPEIELFEIADVIRSWPMAKDEKKDLDTFCGHGNRKGTWCRDCYHLMGADYPEYLTMDRKGKS